VVNILNSEFNGATASNSGGMFFYKSSATTTSVQLIFKDLVVSGTHAELTGGGGIYLDLLGPSNDIQIITSIFSVCQMFAGDGGAVCINSPSTVCRQLYQTRLKSNNTTITGKYCLECDW